MGVDRIVRLAVPVLGVLYPIVIVLILATLFSEYVKDDRVITRTIYTTFAVSLVDTMNIFGLRRFTSMLPLAENGFAWVVPAISVFVVMTFEHVLGLDDRFRRAKH